MASPLIGRAKCPECGFESAHVKRSERCLYRYCPECSSQYHAKTERQQELLKQKMRPVGEATPTPTPTPGEPTPTPTQGEDVEVAQAVPTVPTPTHAPAPTPKRRGLFV